MLSKPGRTPPLLTRRLTSWCPNGIVSRLDGRPSPYCTRQTYYTISLFLQLTLCGRGRSLASYSWRKDSRKVATDGAAGAAITTLTLPDYQARVQPATDTRIRIQQAGRATGPTATHPTDKRLSCTITTTARRSKCTTRDTRPIVCRCTTDSLRSTFTSTGILGAASIRCSLDLPCTTWGGCPLRGITTTGTIEATDRVPESTADWA